MEGFRSLKEGEQVEFTYKKSSKGLESLRVTGPGGGPCAGSERRPKGKVPLQKRKPKGDRWVLRGKTEWPGKWQKKKGITMIFCVCRNGSYCTHANPTGFIEQNLNVCELCFPESSAAYSRRRHMLYVHLTAASHFWVGWDYRLNLFNLPGYMPVAMVIVRHNKELNRALCLPLPLF